MHSDALKGYRPGPRSWRMLSQWDYHCFVAHTRAFYINKGCVPSGGLSDFPSLTS
ncbi:hypothetical protein CONPUDRAFT_85520 [Coniophora puteana RWD-64-598 SS2]|uniref:Uncharacterized protein n=1 Tax=Coniophora puteana (strain RWD-64-598) TaxID=741705 RepID=A0A5M3M7L6_CONPW|nr:uncharacterized protein CONPUDRAFT_85520 [Coniophora puteana RWD-64-598 SS2]EIW75272.1 hypothetical protein CONPUDRAFT_85520 [Coniophora puteana RWD-64-598 SS2]